MEFQIVDQQEAQNNPENLLVTNVPLNNNDQQKNTLPQKQYQDANNEMETEDNNMLFNA